MSHLRSKMILFWLGLALIYWLPGCGQKQAPSKVKWVIGFSQCNSAEPWREAMNKALFAAAKNYPELEVIIADAVQDNAKQVADVENFIVKEVDLLIISPNEAQPLTAVVEKAFNQGMPVVVLDRAIIGESYTCFIGADNVAIGKAAGEHVAQILGGRGRIVEIWGLTGSTPAQERHDGFMAGLQSAPGIQIIYAQDGAWLQSRGKEIMENALQAYEKIDLVYAHNDPMAVGAYLAAKEARREQNIKFIGIDGLPGPEGGCQAVLDGQLAATFLYPNCGQEAIMYALKILRGETVPRRVTLPTAKITVENANHYL
ncbi:substrate-binding domain-containing protein [candidate division KSB1 bacterium]|nr:substrate-binding domain-containing protein [candidate division KSB1 bacterium]